MDRTNGRQWLQGGVLIREAVKVMDHGTFKRRTKLPNMKISIYNPAGKKDRGEQCLRHPPA